jgi:hypothetical protein
LQALQFQKIDVYRKFPGGEGISHYRSEFLWRISLMFAFNLSLLNRE